MGCDFYVMERIVGDPRQDFSIDLGLKEAVRRLCLNVIDKLIELRTRGL